MQIKSIGIDLGKTPSTSPPGNPRPGGNPQEVLTFPTGGVQGQSVFLVDRDGGGGWDRIFWDAPCANIRCV